MSSDLTFITNEEGQSLEKRFSDLIKDTRFFDCLVGYFYASGFHMLYDFTPKEIKIVEEFCNENTTKKSRGA